MRIAMSSVIQLDSFIHPVVLFVNCLNCMMVHKFICVNLLKESHIKTINLGRGEGEMVIRPSLHPRTCMSTCLVGSPE